MSYLEKIVAEASDQFIDIGIKSVSMDDVARALAISKKTLYLYVKNKENLLSLIANSLSSTFDDQLSSCCKQMENTPKERLKYLGAYILFFTQENYQFLEQLKKLYPVIWEGLYCRQRMVIETILDPLYHQITSDHSLKEEIDSSTLRYVFTKACQLRGYEGMKKEDWDFYHDLTNALIDGLFHQ
ncbi:TetR/AcrR family transcriptional regulator [Lewinella cohaerens]|uniref:TetR/AcrR family transcriptional regulator n=1 Tax=Lewinella cohaerens TaxID=70995 RepID=UPI00036D2B8F|nr:TetR/AcrR family transcriptional regulator [Lewinella cohaerens]